MDCQHKKFTIRYIDIFQAYGMRIILVLLADKTNILAMYAMIFNVNMYISKYVPVTIQGRWNRVGGVGNCPPSFWIPMY